MEDTDTGVFRSQLNSEYRGEKIAFLYPLDAFNKNYWANTNLHISYIEEDMTPVPYKRYSCQLWDISSLT